jgi:hypothetical protein
LIYVFFYSSLNLALCYLDPVITEIVSVKA